MNRRDLIKFIPAIAAIPGITVRHVGEDIGKSFELNDKSRYLCIVDEEMIDIEAFCANHEGHGLPPGTPVVAVRTRYGSIDNALRIYKLEDE